MRICEPDKIIPRTRIENAFERRGIYFAGEQTELMEETL
jgi:hypothetical protein